MHVQRAWPAPSAAVDVERLRRVLPPRPRTRFAPSPTGFLHLGHVVNAIYVWGLARALGGEVVLRIEDHDRTRCRPEYLHAVLEDLDWLGFTADAPIDRQPAWRQSDHPQAYEAAVDALRAQGARLFWCECSRRDILAAAPGAGDVETPYPLTCLDKGLEAGRGRGLRLVLPDTTEAFDDGRLGPQEQHPRAQCGALLVRDRDACWSYQFAVSVDDLRHGIDLVVRGEDLVASTGRQIQLARLLGRRSPAVFVHHGLIRHSRGDKLSKSNRDTGVRDLRAAGWSAERVIGHAAWRAGLSSHEATIPAVEASALVAGPPRS